MLGYCAKISDVLEALRTDRAGVVSFEFVILAVCVVVGVAAVFGPGNNIAAALAAAVSAISTAIVTAAGA